MNASNIDIIINLNNTNTYSDKNELTFMAYYSLLMVILGTIFNVLTFIILCRKKFRNVQTRPMIHYMRGIAMIDLFGSYGWTLDTYLDIIHGFTLNYSYTIGSCKFFSFFNYFTYHISAWLQVFICFDRYLFLSRIQPNTWFNRSKSVLIIISLIVGFFFLFNLHMLIFVCYEDASGYFIMGSKLYELFPTYGIVHLVIYNIIPSIFILLFNSVSIYYLNRLRCTTTIRNSQIRHRPISITLIITSFIFIITRTPSSIYYAFFYNSLPANELNRRLTIIFNLFQYTYPILNFPVYLITFSEFRQELINLVTRRRVIAPLLGGTIQRHIVQTNLQFETHIA